MPDILVSVCRFLVFCAVALCVTIVRRFNLSTTTKVLVLLAALFGLLNAALILTEQWGENPIRQELLAGQTWFNSYLHLYLVFVMAIGSSRVIDRIIF
jgi:hypothetical protein